jgi:hypothetical protein
MSRRRGVMSPPPYDGPPQRGLMAPGPCADLNHASAIRTLLWVVAAVLALVELLLAAMPSG